MAIAPKTISAPSRRPRTVVSESGIVCLDPFVLEAFAVACANIPYLFL
jgi:hypothetical protein